MAACMHAPRNSKHMCLTSGSKSGLTGNNMLSVLTVRSIVISTSVHNHLHHCWWTTNKCFLNKRWHNHAVRCFVFFQTVANFILLLQYNYTYVHTWELWFVCKNLIPELTRCLMVSLLRQHNLLLIIFSDSIPLGLILHIALASFIDQENSWLWTKHCWLMYLYKCCRCIVIHFRFIP